METTVAQTTALPVLKRIGTRPCLLRPSGTLQNTALVFADPTSQADHDQLSYFAVILSGDVAEGKSTHVSSWSSHKSKRPTRSIVAAEVQAASLPIDEGKRLKPALSLQLRMPIPLNIVVDSKYLYMSLSTRRKSIDKSTRADVHVVRSELEVANSDAMYWLLGSVLHASPGTKTDSPHCQALQLLVHSGNIPLDLPRHESCRFDRILGRKQN